MTAIDELMSHWRINYGLDTRTPQEAMLWWNEKNGGFAPSGAIAALGIALQEIDALRRQIGDLELEIEGEVKENAALRRHADNMALAIECAEGFEARDLDFAFDYRQWSKGK